jgi:hypothetical protein
MVHPVLALRLFPQRGLQSPIPRALFIMRYSLSSIVDISSFAIGDRTLSLYRRSYNLYNPLHRLISEENSNSTPFSKKQQL